MGLRRLDKKEMNKLARSCGATIVNTFATSDGSE